MDLHVILMQRLCYFLNPFNFLALHLCCKSEHWELFNYFYFILIYTMHAKYCICHVITMSKFINKYIADIHIIMKIIYIILNNYL